MIVEECIRLFALRVNARLRESAKMQIGRVRRYENGLHSGVRSALTQEDLIPIYAQIGDDSNLAARGKKLDWDHDRLWLSGRHAHIGIHGFPGAGGVLHLEIRHDQASLRLL